MLQFGAILQNRYQIAALLGQGGFGAVYRANDLRLAGRAVAVKENLASDPEAVAAFQNEAHLLARLQHDNLPRVTDHFIDPSGAQYLVMDYIEGENLEDAVTRRGPLPEKEALDVMGQVNAAVSYLHSQHVVHRDIKPANLICRAADQRVLLVDFGIAKTDTHGKATLTGARAATPGFAPPEQYFGHTDVRSDVYALGAMLYYLLTGREPPEATARAAGIAPLIPLRQVNPSISTGVAAAVSHALEMDTSRRLQSVDQLRAALQAAPMPAPIPTPVPAPRRGSPAHIRPLVGAGAALLVVVVLAVVIGAQASRRAAVVTPGALQAGGPQAAPAARSTVPPAVVAATPEPPTIAPLALAPANDPAIGATPAEAPASAPAPIETRALSTRPPAGLSRAAQATGTAEACQPGETFAAVWAPRRTALGCPKGSVGMRTFTLQGFEDGQMIWSRATDQVYVLRKGGKWSMGKNTWESGQPLYSCDAAARAGMPRMVFGKVWCEDAEVSAAMGAAMGLEQADDNAWLQFFDQGFIMEGFGGRLFVLYDDGGWEELPSGV